jgi:DNA-binding response OmpR family regulator
VATILLVEDDEDLAFAIKMWLERKNHKIEAVTTGLEALEQMQYGTFDLIILDGLLPDMQGVDICRHFRAAGGTVPILMLSGNALETHKDSGLEAGANDYLAKPFAIEELTLRIQSLLAKAGTK